MAAAAQLAMDDYGRPPSLLDGLASLMGIVRGTDVQRGSEPQTKLEFLFDDEQGVGPSLGARMCYGAGITYMSGLALGGLWGLSDGLRNPVGLASPRLRLNCVLNACTARGPFVANNAACAALLYNAIHGGVLRALGPDREQDVVTAAGSAGLAGAVFRSTRGLRSSALAAGASCAAMALYQVLAGRPVSL
jgi:hypothetical protein